MSYEALWVRYFALTVAIELVVALPLLRSTGDTLARRATAVLVANVASHPILWFVLARVLASRTSLVVVGEAWAVASEAVVYALVFPAMERTRALGVSAVANGASFLVGTALAHC